MQPLLLRTALAVIALAGICSVAAAAEDCGWLPAGKLDEAFPEHGPWSTLVGGKVGSCKFTSDSRRPPNIFGANQMVKSSAAEAEEFVRGLKSSIAESYDVEPAPALGKEGFRYRPKGAEADRSLFFVAHRKKVAVLGSMTFQKAITAAEVKAGEVLAGAALAVADDEEAIAAATNCPWLDPKLIRQLLPGEDFSENVFGSKSCMANAAGAVVILSIVEDASAELMAARSDSGCTSQPLPQLGEVASIQYACTTGNPRASVRFLSRSKMFDVSLVPAQEPTAAERALLVKLAEHAFSRSK